MRRVRNLALVGVGTLALAAVVIWTFRAQLAPGLGVSLDTGPGGRAALVLPEGYAATVFAEGLWAPRFMAVSPDGGLFVAERGADRIVALPDENGDGVADEVIEVGTGYGSAHDLEFTADGGLLVAGEEALFEVSLDGLHETDRRVVVELPTGAVTTPRRSTFSRRPLSSSRSARRATSASRRIRAVPPSRP